MWKGLKSLNRALGRSQCDPYSCIQQVLAEILALPGDRMHRNRDKNDVDSEVVFPTKSHSAVPMVLLTKPPEVRRNFIGVLRGLKAPDRLSNVNARSLPNRRSFHSS